jgi:hypothetical protein
MKKIAIHRCWESQSTTQFWFDEVIVAGIKDCLFWDSQRIYLELYNVLMEMQDTQEEWRLGMREERREEGGGGKKEEGGGRRREEGGRWREEGGGMREERGRRRRAICANLSKKQESPSSSKFPRNTKKTRTLIPATFPGLKLW